MELKEGWKCTSCQTIWAPTVKSCEKCTVQESKKDTRQLLTEIDVRPFGKYPLST